MISLYQYGSGAVRSPVNNLQQGVFEDAGHYFKQCVPPVDLSALPGHPEQKYCSIVRGPPVPFLTS